MVSVVSPKRNGTGPPTGGIRRTRGPATAPVITGAVLLAFTGLAGCTSEEPTSPATDIRVEPRNWSGNLPRVKPEAVGMSTPALQHLVRTVQYWIDAEEINGGALRILRHGHTVLDTVLGWNHREEGVALTKHNIYQVASMTKPLSGTALMILVEEGLVDINDPIMTYLPEFDTDDKRDITVAQALSHSSGLRAATGGSAVERARAMANLSLSYEPGTQATYSNAGSIIAGAIVETISGMMLRDFLRQRIFHPLHMNHTWCGAPVPEWVDPARIAARYRGDAGNWWLAHQMGATSSSIDCSPSGGASSTLDDYARFMIAMLNGGQLDGARILQPETVLLATSEHSGYATSDDYRATETRYFGLQWYVESDRYRPHPGPPMSPGYFSHGGMWGTYTFADREYDLVALYFTQCMRHGTRQAFIELVYEALLD